jgi:cytochrome c oxidase subunit 2
MKQILSISAILSLFSSVAVAAENHYEGMAKNWQLGMQEPATPVMEQLVWMHDNILLGMCIGISIFVLALLLYVCVRFSRKNNPVPSKTSHNTKLEIIWTTLPILILILIAIPSLRLHYFMERDIEPEMTLKVVGYQWYWHYEYPDQKGINFDSYMLKDKDLKEGDHRMLAVDNRVVVPVDTKIRVLITGADVIHSFAVPAFGIKRDGIPGRLNETWFKATKVGTFYGQCSELCGVGHGFMPIVIDVVSKDDFSKWVASKKK